MNAVLSWVKSNIYIVVFLAVMILAPIGLTILGSYMNGDVREQVKSRAAKLSQLDALKKGQVAIDVPGTVSIKGEGVINQATNDRIEAVLATIKTDAGRVTEKALTFNRKDRGLLVPEIFPEPPVHERETLPAKMHRELEAAYTKLLEQMEAGWPPSPAEVQEELKAVQERVISKEGAALGAEERQALTEQLTTTRLSMYGDAAKRLKVYATLASLDVPLESQVPARAEDAALVDLFNWQWDFWVKQDIAQAIRSANESADSVIEAAVKRVVSVRVYDAPQAAPAAQDSGGGGDGGGFGMAGGGQSAKRAGGGAAGAPARRQPSSKGPAEAAAKPASTAAPVINTAAEVALDYGISFTGRKSNHVYDVRRVMLDVIVDTHQAPALLDALSRQNLITILDVDMAPVNVFDEIRDGFFYGPDPVSRLTLELETIWLRAWTMPLMPVALRDGLLAGTAAQGAGPGAGRSSGARKGAGDEEEEEEEDG